jgi:iron complex transport system substrate-binding protein
MVALKADLVIVSTASQLEAFVKNLDKLQIPVYVSDPRNLDGVLASIERIGELGGVADRSRELTGTLRARIDTVESRVSGLNRPRVLFILGTSPLITVGGRGFIDDLINRAGGRSISAGQSGDYPQFSLESAVAAQPEVIFLQSGETELSGSLKNTTAARDGRIFRLDDALLLRPGPRIVDGLEKMAARIHPEAFGEVENTK